MIAGLVIGSAIAFLPVMAALFANHGLGLRNKDPGIIRCATHYLQHHRLRGGDADLSILSFAADDVYDDRFSTGQEAGIGSYQRQHQGQDE
jgi:hypothetical protein